MLTIAGTTKGYLSTSTATKLGSDAGATSTIYIANHLLPGAIKKVDKNRSLVCVVYDNIHFVTRIFCKQILYMQINLLGLICTTIMAIFCIKPPYLYLT